MVVGCVLTLAGTALAQQQQQQQQPQ